MKSHFIKTFQKHIVVEGMGDFPLDMLRYDSAFPMTEQDSHIAANQFEKRRVALTVRAANDLGPTVDRWRSFTWQVVGIFRERLEAEDCRRAPCSKVTS